jgi:hypothetical protein
VTSIAKRTGWTFNHVDGRDVQGLMAAVAEDRAEMAASDISITADHAKRFDSTSSDCSSQRPCWLDIALGGRWCHGC